MNVAGQAWEDANLARASELLELCRPQPSEPDMREFAWYYLWRLCQPDSMTMKHGGETMDVWKVAWSPDGKLLASAGIHSAVKLWDAATGRLRATLEHDAAVAVGRGILSRRQDIGHGIGSGRRATTATEAVEYGDSCPDRLF